MSVEYKRRYFEKRKLAHFCKRKCKIKVTVLTENMPIFGVCMLPIAF